MQVEEVNTNSKVTELRIGVSQMTQGPAHAGTNSERPYLTKSS